MAQTEKTYARIIEGEEIVKALCTRYPDELWAVNPNIIMVMGIDNKERGKKNKTLAKIVSVRGVEKAIFQEHNVNVRYVIELYYSDWNEWTSKKKQLVIFHELQHVSSKGMGCVKHDCEDFRMMLDVLGVDWSEKEDSQLPNLLNDTDKVKFNLDLRANMIEYCEENGIEMKDLKAENAEDAAEDEEIEPIELISEEKSDA